MLDVAVIIVSWNVRDYLANCLASLYADLGRSDLAGEAWVVDNGSTDGTQALLTDLFPQTHLIQNQENVGFGAANNQGMRAALAQADGVRYFLLLNPDTLVRPFALQHMAACLDACSETGLVGARLVYGDGRFQHSAFAFPRLTQLAFDLWPVPWRLYESRLNGRYPRWYFQARRSPFVVDCVLGAAMMVRRDVAESTGGFDESFYMYCEEIDWCWRIREAGWTIRSVPQAEIVHFGGESTRQVPAHSVLNLWRSRAQLYQKHHKLPVVWLASHIAQRGLTRQAKRARDVRLRQAYSSAAAAWRDCRRQPTQV